MCMSKRKLLKSSVALLLSSLIAASGATVFTANAAEADTSKSNDTAEQSKTITEDSYSDEPTEPSKETADQTDDTNDDLFVEFDGVKYATGAVPMTEEEKSKLPTISTLSEYKEAVEESGNKSQFISDDSTVSDLPSFVDNSQSKYFPEIGDQGGVGSCVAWSCIYYQMSYSVNKMLDRASTKDNSMSPLWVYNYGNAGNPDTGMSEFSITSILRTAGVPTLRTSPNRYDGVSWSSTKSSGTEAQKYKSTLMQQLKIGSAQIDNPNSESLQVVKTALANGDILSATTDSGGWEYYIISKDSRVPENNKYAGELIIPYLTGYGGLHKITIVGYDDNIWCDINNDGKVQTAEKGAFKIANSWGTDFANDGFVWMSYDSLNSISAVDSKLASVRSTISSLSTILRIVPRPLEEASNIHLEFDLAAQSRYESRVTIIAEDAKGNKQTREVTPFSTNLYSKQIAISPKRTFVYDLNAVISDISSEHLADYKWSVKFEDTKNNELKTTISNVKIVDNNFDTEYRSGAADKTIDGTSCEIAIDTTSKNAVSLLDTSDPDVQDLFTIR